MYFTRRKKKENKTKYIILNILIFIRILVCGIKAISFLSVTYLTINYKLFYIPAVKRPLGGSLAAKPFLSGRAMYVYLHIIMISQQA